MIYLIIIITAVLARLVPHAWNFAPVTAVAIVAAVYLNKKTAIGLTFAVRLISDAIIGFFSWPLMAAVYLSHLFGVLMGSWVRRKKSVGRVLVAPAISALVFFLVTNLAFLYPNYTHDWSGIISAYVNGLPFLRGTLLGDIIYTVALVGGFEAVFYYKKHFSRRFFVFWG